MGHNMFSNPIVMMNLSNKIKQVFSRISKQKAHLFFPHHSTCNSELITIHLK